jgi:hypothetical protein
MTPANQDAERNPAPDEVRRKFREALERKRGKHEEHRLAGPEDTGSTHTGPAKPQRTFRRKSG